MPKPTLKSITKSPKALIIIALVVLGLFVMSSTPSPTADLGAVKLTGSQVQPVDYKISESVSNLIPFKTAMVLDARTNEWISFVISKNSIKISSQTLTTPNYKLYPTPQQIIELENIINDINNNGVNLKNQIQISVLWIQIKKQKIS